MIDHMPFIVGAYAAFFIVLAYTAAAPVLRGRRIRQAVRRYQQRLKTASEQPGKRP